MKMWEILERDSGEFGRREPMEQTRMKDMLEDAYKCGYKEGFADGSSSYGERSGMSSHRYGERTTPPMYGERMSGR